MTVAGFQTDDQNLYLLANGKVSFTPPYSAIGLIALPYPVLAKEEEEFLKGHLKKCLDYAIQHPDAYSKEIQKYVNYDIGPRARMLWLLNRVVDSIPNEEWVQISDGQADMEGVEGFKRKAKGIVGSRLYWGQYPSEFESFMKSLQTHQSSWLKRVGTLFTQQKEEMQSPEANQFAAEEASLWLREQGVEQHSPTGNGETLFSDADKTALSGYIKKCTQERRNNLDGLIAEMRESVTQKGGAFAEYPANTVIIEELLALPKKTNKELSPLLDIALQDETLNIFLFKGMLLGNMFGTYGGYQAAAGVYQPDEKKAFLPKGDDGYRAKTIAEAQRKTIEGGFSFLNDHAVLIESPASKEIVWKEELWHHTLQRLFNNYGLPFSKNDKTFQRKFSNALADDIERKEFAVTLAPYIHTTAERDGKKLAALVRMNTGGFDRPTFEAIGREAITAVMQIIEEKGWGGAGNYAPNLTKYIQKELLPFAMKKAKEWDVELSQFPTPGRLESRPINFPGAPPTGQNSGSPPR